MDAYFRQKLSVRLAEGRWQDRSADVRRTDAAGQVEMSNCRAKQRAGASHGNSNYIKTRNAVALIEAAFSSAVSAVVISGQIVVLS
jgi:hypothetical protein